MRPSSTSNAGRVAPGLLAALALAGGLAACAEADLYFDRRDTISFHAGDAVAANIITQTVDPWPRVAANRDIRFNGERMQAAAERYRTGKVYEPRGLGGTSSASAEPQASSGE
jgi:hypothetical protein